MKFIKQAEGESMCNDESFLMLGYDELEEVQRGHVNSDFQDAQSANEKEAFLQLTRTSYYNQASNDALDVRFGQRLAASASSETACIASNGDPHVTISRQNFATHSQQGSDGRRRHHLGVWHGLPTPR